MADQRPQNPRQITLLEYILGRGRGAPGQSGANRVDSQADSVRHFRNNALPAYIGQNGPIAPPDPFSGDAGGSMPPGPTMQPRTVTSNPQPQLGINPALLASAFPGSNAPGPVPQGAGPSTRAPTPQSEAEIMAAIAAMDPTFNAGQVPMLSAMEDGPPPIGDVLTIEAPPLPARPPAGPPPVGDILNIPAPGRGVYRPDANGEAVLRTPVPGAPQQAFSQPPIEIGGPPAAGPRPFAQAPQPADVSFAPWGGSPAASPPRGLLRRPIPTPTLNNAAATPIQAPPPTALLNAEQFLAASPLPPQQAPQAPAAQTQAAPAPVPASQGGAQVKPPAPAIGEKLPQHLKDQLLAEAARLTAKKHATAPLQGKI